MKWNPSGDANGDGSVSVADIVTMQKWLLGSASVKLSDLKAVDFCRDNKLECFACFRMNDTHDGGRRLWLKDWHLSPAYVGFFLHYNPHPFHR